MRKNMIYLFAGVNGSGKTTLISEIVKESNIVTFRGSLELMKWLGLREGDYDGLRQLPREYKDEQVELMMENLFNKYNSNEYDLIIDAHIFNYNHGELQNAVGHWIRWIDCLCVIECLPEIIVERINLDQRRGLKSRNIYPESLSEYEKIELTRIYIERTREKAIEISNTYNIPMCILNNSTHLELTLRMFYELHLSNHLESPLLFFK